MNLGDPIATGNTARIHLHENKIIKIFKDHLPDTESAYEATKQRNAYASGLPVPKVLDVTKVKGNPAIVMEYVKGKTIGDLVSDNMEQAEYYMNISVEVQHKIHMAPADSFEQMAEKLQRQIESVQILDEKLKSSVLRKLDSMIYIYENRLCHGDFHLYNLIMSDNKVTIIDWIDASAGDIRADVYRTYLLYSQHSMEIAEMYLKLYCEKSGLSRDEVFQWAPIIAAARLSEHVSTEAPERLMDIIRRGL